MSLTAPFPYYGGKSRIAKAVWRELGDVTVYVEPFAGSLAVLLASEPHAREIVTDTDGHIPNFWRALRSDPEAVAYFADYPTFHHDLRARHIWLIRWAAEYSGMLSEDPDWYCPKAAGWWAWGQSNWIGGQWCRRFSDSRPRVKAAGGQGTQAQRVSTPHDRRPLVAATGGGKGVSVQRTEQVVWDKRPYVQDRGGGRGTQVQRSGLMPLDDQIPKVNDHGGAVGVSAQRETPAIPDQIPLVGIRAGGSGVQAQRLLIPLDEQVPALMPTTGGRGVQAQREELDGSIGTGDRLIPWFEALGQGLARVVVLNRSWESAVTPTLLMHTPTAPKPPVGIFMDPPYRTTHRQKDLYQSDMDGESDDIAAAAYEWAVQHGETYRIAFCCHQKDFPVPEGWRSSMSTFGGISREDRRAENLDMVMFSPACVGDQEDTEGQLAMGGLG